MRYNHVLNIAKNLKSEFTNKLTMLIAYNGKMSANDIIKSFTITSDKNRTFNINFQNKSSSSLYIYAYFQNEITKIEYENNFSLEGLKDNKYLSLFDTINDIFEEIISILNKNLKEVILFLLV